MCAVIRSARAHPRTGAGLSDSLSALRLRPSAYGADASAFRDEGATGNALFAVKRIYGFYRCIGCCFGGVRWGRRFGFRFGGALADVAEDGEDGFAILRRGFDVTPAMAELVKAIQGGVGKAAEDVLDLAVVQFYIQALRFDLAG